MFGQISRVNIPVIRCPWGFQFVFLTEHLHTGHTAGHELVVTAVPSNSCRPPLNVIGLSLAQSLPPLSEVRLRIGS
jgi:hypothetical protein